MSALLSSHLEQISLCARSIGDLTFAGPKPFTNALLSTRDITALIRDTEQHERALFHLAPPQLSSSTSGEYATSSLLASTGQGFGNAGAGLVGNRRATVHAAQRAPKNKAVAAVLGGDLFRKTRANEGAERQKGEVDVELLLAGAEKLAAVYPIAGAADKIAQLRRRHHQLSANVAHYEAHVAQQARDLQALSGPSRHSYAGGLDADIDEAADDKDDTITIPLTMEDLEREEQEIRELESKKRSLEERVTGMEKDLGGLLR